MLRAEDASAAVPATSPTERVRLLLFTNSVAIGGMERHIEMIVRDLDRSRVEIFTVCPDWPATDPWVQSLEADAEHSARITPDRRHGVARFVTDSIRLWRQLRRWRIQVMHMHLTTFKGGFTALLAAQLAGVKVILCTEHLSPQHEQPFGVRLRRNLFSRIVDQIVCVSYQNRQLRERFLYTPRAKVTVINNGVDVAQLEPPPDADLARLRADLGIPSDAPIVGTAVRFAKEKGLEYLLDAMPRVLSASPDAYLLLAGDGSERRNLEEQATALGIRERVIFAGFQADPRPYISLMNAFVLPWPWGSASIGVLEAMAMRRAVVVTFGGDGEPVIDGATGLHVRPRDPAALAEAILKIIENPSYERELGQRARQRIEDEYTSQVVARQLLTLYTRELAAAD